MFLDRHLYRGRLNYLLFGRPVSAFKSWLHRITAPAVAVPEQPPIPDSQIVEDIALRRSYPYMPPIPEAQDAEPRGEDAAPAQEPPPASLPETSAAVVSAPAAPAEQDDYDEDEEYLRYRAEHQDEPQPGAVDADDFLVLLSVFSKSNDASLDEITTARRAMRAISGSEIEQVILDQLNDKDGSVAAMLKLVAPGLHDDNTPPENESPERTFRLEDYVRNV